MVGDSTCALSSRMGSMARRDRHGGRPFTMVECCVGRVVVERPSTYGSIFQPRSGGAPIEVNGPAA